MCSENSILLFKEALLRLLVTMPLQDITVNQLALEAKLGRSTFYVYYDDIFSLYEEMIAEHLEPLRDFVKCMDRGGGRVRPQDIRCEKKKIWAAFMTSFVKIRIFIW